MSTTHTICVLQKKKLFGVSVRTSNKDEFNPSYAKIPLCIQKFYGEKLFEKIVHPINPRFAIGAYTQYETDHTGKYTYFIGMEVDLNEQCPADLEELIIPEGNYVECITQTGKMPDVLVHTWQKIWRMSAQELGGIRAYEVDFELYDQATTDSNNTNSKIYIGIQ